MNHTLIKTLTKTSFLFLTFLAFSCSVPEQTEDVVNSADEKISLEAAVEKLGNCLLDPTEDNLLAITHPDLTYGHSTGTIEDLPTFMDVLISGKNDYKTYETTDQSLNIEGNTAWVRHMMHAKIGLPEEDVEVHLKVLTVWLKIEGSWKLFARQAVK